MWIKSIQWFEESTNGIALCGKKGLKVTNGINYIKFEQDTGWGMHTSNKNLLSFQYYNSSDTDNSQAWKKVWGKVYTKVNT